MAKTPQCCSASTHSPWGPLFLRVPRLVHECVCWWEGAAQWALQTRYAWSTHPHINNKDNRSLTHFMVLLDYIICRRTCNFLVQEWGWENGIWHPKRLEDIRHQQQVQVMVAFSQDTCCLVDISYSPLEERSNVCFYWHPFILCVYVSDSRRLYYCTLLALHPGQMRAQPWIRCLLTATFVEPSKLFSSASLCFHVLLNYCHPLPLCRLCPSYPQQLLVPAWITDKELENVATFRSWKRIPAVVYRFAKPQLLPHLLKLSDGLI